MQRKRGWIKKISPYYKKCGNEHLLNMYGNVGLIILSKTVDKN